MEHGVKSKKQRSWLGTRSLSCSGVIVPKGTGGERSQVCFSKFNAHTDILRLLLKWTFWFRRAESGPRHCISNKLQANVTVIGPVTLNSQGVRSPWPGTPDLVPIGLFLADISFESLRSVSSAGPSTVSWLARVMSVSGAYWAMPTFWKVTLTTTLLFEDWELFSLCGD